MSTLISKVFVNALYYPEPDQSDKEMMRGYVKATVNNRIVTEHRAKWVPNPYYPLFFVPFIIRDLEYFLKIHEACTAQDVTPPYWNVLKIKWELKPITPPAREQPRLETILSKLQSHLPEIVQQAKPLKGRKQLQRRRFLGQFPLPLREGIDEKVMYGTISPKYTPIEYNIYEQELSTYAAEDKIPRNPSLKARGPIPVKLFNQQ